MASPTLECFYCHSAASHYISQRALESFSRGVVQPEDCEIDSSCAQDLPLDARITLVCLACFLTRAKEYSTKGLPSPCGKEAVDVKEESQSEVSLEGSYSSSYISYSGSRIMLPEDLGLEPQNVIESEILLQPIGPEQAEAKRAIPQPRPVNQPRSVCLTCATNTAIVTLGSAACVGICVMVYYLTKLLIQSYHDD